MEPIEVAKSMLDLERKLLEAKHQKGTLGATAG